MDNIASKIFIALFCFFCMSCKIATVNTKNKKNELYAIIEKGNYKNGDLYFKTESYQKFSEKLNYNYLNKYNVKNNSILELDRYVNFDSIFSPYQISEIGKSFNTINQRKIKKSFLSKPEILSKEINCEIGMKKGERSGCLRITYPFIIKSKKGTDYAFIYRNTGMGILYVYKKYNGRWDEFARVEIWVE